MSNDTGHGSDDMDLKAHLRTWHGFMRLVQWIVGGNIVLLLFLFLFRTHN